MAGHNGIIAFQRNDNIDDCFSEDTKFSTEVRPRPEENFQLTSEELKHCCSYLMDNGEVRRAELSDEQKLREKAETIEQLKKRKHNLTQFIFYKENKRRLSDLKQARAPQFGPTLSNQERANQQQYFQENPGHDETQYFLKMGRKRDEKIARKTRLFDRDQHRAANLGSNSAGVKAPMAT